MVVSPEPLLVRCRSPWPGRTDRTITLAPGQDLFTGLRAAGLPIASSCTGRVVCGRCVLGILEGAELLPPPALEEAAALARVDAAPGERLACMAAPLASGLVVTASYW